MDKYIIIEYDNPIYINIKSDETGKPLQFDTLEEAQLKCENIEQVVKISL